LKSVLKHPLVQRLLIGLLTAYVNFALETTRWRFEDRAGVDAMVASPQGAIGAFWHGRITMAVVCRRVLKHKERRVIISASRDGEMTARVVEQLGFPSLRGSAAKKGKDADKGGAAVFRQALRFMRDGGLIAITPDGPRGPNQIMPQGTVIMAQAAKVPVVLVGLAAEPALQFKSWDKARIPLPFGRGCVVFDGPLYAPDATDEETREATRLDWQTRLNAAQAKAEAILAGGSA
jgi:lysophospholipid acyltransferase (LPLAT)-like uncharacterized protein